MKTSPSRAAAACGRRSGIIPVPANVWYATRLPPIMSLGSRPDSSDSTIKMPPLARNLVDTNAMSVLVDWINSLPGTPALAPPIISPPGGLFQSSVSISLQSTNGGDDLYYTLDGSLPNTSSFPYTGP